MARLVFAISLDDAQKVINVRSPLVLHNLTELPLEVRLQASTVARGNSKYTARKGTESEWMGLEELVSTQVFSDLHMSQFTLATDVCTLCLLTLPSHLLPSHLLPSQQLWSWAQLLPVDTCPSPSTSLTGRSECARRAGGCGSAASQLNGVR